MSQEKFNLFILSIAGIVIMSIAGMIVFYNYDENQKIADLIKSGQNPVAVRCAFENSLGTHPDCILFISQIGNQ